MSDKLTLELKETPEPLKMKLSSGVGQIPRNAIRTVNSLPENAVPGQVVALVSEDEEYSDGFYIAQETEDGTVQWNLFLTATGITEVSDYSITGRKIKPYEITKRHFSFGAVDSDALAALAVLTGHISNGAVTTEKVKENAITDSKIAEKAITESKIADNSIGTSKYKVKSIGGSHIASRTINSSNLNFDSVETFAIKNGAVTPEKLDRQYATPDDVKKAVEGIEIPDTEIKDGSIESRHLSQFAVTGDKIAENAVTEYQIAENAVKTRHIADYSITSEKLYGKIIDSNHIKEKAVGNTELCNNAVTDEKIANKTISKGKMAFDVATEDFVRNSIRNISGGKPLIGDVVSILDDFEGYEIHQVVKTTDLIPKNWSNVKVFSVDDGITDTTVNPMEFDFSQIAETNYVKTKVLPSQIDFSSINGKNVICSMVFQDNEMKKFMCIQLLQSAGINAEMQAILYNGDEDAYYEAHYTTENGWTTSAGEQLTEEQLKIFEGTYPSLKIVDFASLHKDNPDVAPEGVECSSEILVNLFLKDWMQVYYPMGYYLTDKSADSIPKSWAEVQRVVRSGQASKVFNIGDQLICEKNGIAHVWDIIGIDYDTPLNPNYTHSITLQLNTAIESRAFDDDSNNYSLSSVREYLNGDYLSDFDEDFISVLGGIRKSDLLYNTDEESSEDDAYPGSDVFFLLSADEISTSPYEFYSSADIDSTIRIKSTGIKSVGLANWWLRTGSETETASQIVNTNGVISNGTITRASFYLAPACVIY